ncbi:MAG TPA: hypothetical protein VLH40_08395 [Atribacteraceae bacterium]|nr:hypothetical protein [Atribacteraceae bacterium]
MLEEVIRSKARKLLEEKRVDLIIGWSEGTVSLKTAPKLCRKPEDADQLVWNPLCSVNLARYLKYYKKSPEKIAVLAKACDARAILVLLKEEQISRDRLVILGLPCLGLLNPDRVAEALPGARSRDLEWKVGKLLYRGQPCDTSLLMEETCRRCRHHNPPLADEVIGEPVGEPGYLHDDYLERYNRMDPGEREAFFNEEMTRCIRCYACRNACPLCYCQECFVESTRPLWVTPAPTPFDNLLFQVARSMHMVGRCVECGACERACPVKIPIALFPIKVEEIVQVEYSFEAGLSEESAAPLLTYRENDPEDFIK